MIPVRTPAPHNPDPPGRLMKSALRSGRPQYLVLQLSETKNVFKFKQENLTHL